MKRMKRGDLQSQTINALRFLLIIYVVFIHAYTSTRETIDSAQYPVYRFVSFLFSLEIAQVAVPAFFFISGYLFFYRGKPYPVMLRDKAGTLFIPYVFWNALILLLYMVVESIPYTRAFFSGSNLSVHEYSGLSYLRAFWDGGDWDGGNGTPILHQFWYIRNLILLALLAPLVKYYVKWLRIPGIVVLVLIWMIVPRQDFSAESVTFFVTGAWFSLNGKDFLPLFKRYSKAVWILYPCSLVLNMVMRETHFILWLSRTSYLLGVIFTFNVVSHMLEKWKIRMLPRLAEASFFIFALHDPMLTLFKRGMIRLCSPVTDFSLVAIYFLSVVIVIGVCLVAYVVLRRWAPAFLDFITGYRRKYRDIGKPIPI